LKRTQKRKTNLMDAQVFRYSERSSTLSRISSEPA
jgi:hypothetical protein